MWTKEVLKPENFTNVINGRSLISSPVSTHARLKIPRPTLQKAADDDVSGARAAIVEFDASTWEDIDSALAPKTTLRV